MFYVIITFLLSGGKTMKLINSFRKRMSHKSEADILKEMSYMSGMCLEQVPYQTQDICMKALSISKDNYYLIIDKNDEINSRYFELYPINFKRIIKPSDELKLRAVKHNHKNIEHIKKPTVEMVREAIKQDVKWLSMVRVQNDEWIELAMNTSPDAFPLINKKSEKHSVLAVNHHPKYITLVEKQTEAIVEALLSHKRPLFTSLINIPLSTEFMDRMRRQHNQLEFPLICYERKRT